MPADGGLNYLGGGRWVDGDGNPVPGPGPAARVAGGSFYSGGKWYDAKTGRTVAPGADLAHVKAEAARRKKAAPPAALPEAEGAADAAADYMPAEMRPSEGVFAEGFREYLEKGIRGMSGKNKEGLLKSIEAKKGPINAVERRFLEECLLSGGDVAADRRRRGLEIIGNRVAAEAEARLENAGWTDAARAARKTFHGWSDNARRAAAVARAAKARLKSPVGYERGVAPGGRTGRPVAPQAAGSGSGRQRLWLSAARPDAADDGTSRISRPGAGEADLAEAWESYHEHGVRRMNDAERRAIFDEIKERSRSGPLTGADTEFLESFEEFLDGENAGGVKTDSVEAELSEAWESYHEHGVGGMSDAERRAVFDEIRERERQGAGLTDADEDFLRHFEEFLDEALGIGGTVANRWSDEARAAALEARRAKARTGGGGNPVAKGGGNTSTVTPPPAMMKKDPNMPRGGYPETARFWPVKNMPGMHIVLLKPGDVPYPISERMAEKFESFRFNHGLWVRKPGTYKWVYVGLEDGRDTGTGQVHQGYGRR